MAEPKKDDKSKKVVFKKATNTTLASLRSKFGRPDTVFWDTGIIPINDLWGGGCPSGKFIEIHSQGGMGKTTLTLQIAKELIEQCGVKVGFMDVEHALEDSLKVGVGVSQYEDDDKDAPSFLHISPSSFNEVEETLDYMLAMGYKFIIYDSITMSTISKRAEATIESVQPGAKAAAQAVFLEVFKSKISRAGATVILINQMRFKISFINTTLDPAGGQALQFQTDIRMGMRKVSDIKNEFGVKIGAELELITIKNKLTQPFRAVKVNLYFGKGVNKLETFANILIERQIIIQKGAFFTLPRENDEPFNVQGKVKVYDWIKNNQAYVRSLIEDTTVLVNEGLDPEHAETLNSSESEE